MIQIKLDADRRLNHFLKREEGLILVVQADYIILKVDIPIAILFQNVIDALKAMMSNIYKLY
jgi:hypothetical protein